MNTCGARAVQVHPEFLAQRARFRVQVIDHFHVVGEEADRRRDDICQPAARM
jgi:hypothetical protein